MGEGDRAFEQLRAEVTILRRVVEELQATLEALPTADLSATLGAMARTQIRLLRRVERIADSIGAATPPERLQRELAWARDTALRPAVEGLARVQGETSATLQTLQALIGSVRSTEAHRRALVRTLAIGVAIGLAGFPLLVQPVIDALVEVIVAETPRTHRLPGSDGMAESRGAGSASREGNSSRSVFPIGKEQLSPWRIYLDRENRAVMAPGLVLD